MKAPKTVFPVLMIIGVVLVAIPLVIPMSSYTTGTITVKRVSVDKYVAYMIGAEPDTEYTFQYAFLGLVDPSWQYGGIFVSDAGGMVITFEIALPSQDFPTTFRFVNTETGIATYNTVTVDPANPPPVDNATPDEPPQVSSYMTFLGFGTAMIGGVGTVIQSKKLKLH